MLFGSRFLAFFVCLVWASSSDVGGRNFISRFYIVVNVLEYLDLKIWSEILIIL